MIFYLPDDDLNHCFVPHALHNFVLVN